MVPLTTSSSATCCGQALKASFGGFIGKCRLPNYHCLEAIDEEVFVVRESVALPQGGVRLRYACRWGNEEEPR